MTVQGGITTISKSKSQQVGAPKVVDRVTFQKELDALLVREKAHTHLLLSSFDNSLQLDMFPSGTRMTKASGVSHPPSG